MEPLRYLCSAFGLSSAAGLNAYIPLLTLSIMQNRGLVHLVAPYDVMGQWWCIAILVVLLIVEIVVDKVPGADHVNDIIHTVIRPAAGAVIFAAQAGNITWVHPAVWIVIGLIMSGGVHVAKAVARPVVNVGTAGIGAPIVSTVENFVAMMLSVLAIMMPIMAVLMMVFFGLMLWKMFQKFFGSGRESREFEPVVVTAVPVEAESQVALEAGARQEKDWGGGV